ncbi:EEF1A lysine methyltransferase 2-like [Tubulanus polymorphus]|uniref:EEF1A lysine methyltransferase 2-like n=1 Tax=Tubulanus polymorphus TaxID=672921 RepID=UPI003DA4D875
MSDPVIETSNNELPPSKLGTKEYWEDAYDKELVNYNDSGDIGEVWFGYDSMSRVIRWIEESEDINTEMSVIDLGCGNGAMLVELAELGFSNLTGVDYSENAVKLAKSVAEKDNLDISYEVMDILECLNEDMKYDVCIDKGTYDAISLNPDDAHGCRLRYIENVLKMLKDDGYFIITSCNWTLNELLSQFDKDFQHIHTVPTPSFQYGGKQGNSFTSVVFKRDVLSSQ